MIKLYKTINNQLHFWQTWDTEQKTAIFHWGLVGDKGNQKEVRGNWFNTLKSKVNDEVAKKINEGYAEVAYEDYKLLIILYKLDGPGNRIDLDKRHDLEDFLEQELALTGVGDVNGGGIGGEFMDVCCNVIDFEIAKNVIEKALKNTEYSDYDSIFEQKEEEEEE
jgi:hypothetical protein